MSVTNSSKDLTKSTLTFRIVKCCFVIHGILRKVAPKALLSLRYSLAL